MEDESEQRPRMRRRTKAAGGLLAILLLAGTTAWIERRRIATQFVDDQLAAAGVSGRYRIAGFGPFTQTIEDVVLGDPAHPDLVARRLELRWRYGLGLPTLAAVAGDGVALRGRWRDGRLSFGAIDRLLPRSGAAGATLPDLDVTLRDARLALVTPAGDVAARVAGRGNLAGGFRGVVALAAPYLTASGCTMAPVGGRLVVTVDAGAPRATGPLTIGRAGCARTLALGPGTLDADLRADASLGNVRGRLRLAGFGGRAGDATFGPLAGTLDGDLAHGRLALAAAGIAAPQGRTDRAALDGSYRVDRGVPSFAGRVRLDGASAAPSLVRTAAGLADAGGGTPLAPIAARLGTRLAGLLARSAVTADVTLAEGGRTIRIPRATIVAASGAKARLAAGLDRGSTGWRATGALHGDDLPDSTLDAAGRADRLTARIAMRPYRIADGALALAPVRIVADHGTLRFATVATLSGPLAGGQVRDLVIPIAGTRGTDGTLRLGDGCAPIRFARLDLAGMALDPGRVMLCGAPILAMSPGAGLRLAADARPIRLTGRSGRAPLALALGGLHLATTGFRATDLRLALGAGDDPTRLDVGALDGRFAAPPGGRFAGAEGAIARVPLALSGAAGTWRLADGRLHLEGGLTVADRAAAPRFLPLASDDVALTLAGGRIDATAGLHVRNRREPVARVTLRHDLAQGVGAARIAVPALVFAKGGLQPEMLTPVTLGVVANVAGTLAGEGRIAWGPDGLTSTGDFRTDRLDLAAAFGPVTGIAGTLRFTDLLGLTSAPHQTLHIAAINPGVIVTDGVAHYRLPGGNRVAIEDARWPFAGGTLALDPTTLDFAAAAERRLTFRISALDAAAFIQQLDFPNVAATGTFDGKVPMIFDAAGGRVEGGDLTARGPGTLAYVGELTNAQLGTMGKLAFDALKAIRYAGMDISLDGRLDGEIVSRVRFEGVRQATAERGIVARMIRDLPFRFNIRIRAPFRGLIGTARAYADPALLLQQARAPAPPPAAVQPAASGAVR